MLYQESFEVSMKKGIDWKDITSQVEEIVRKTGVQVGVCNVFLMATTAGLVVNENDLLLIHDIKKMFQELVDEKKLYNHPSNAHSHLRSMLTRKEVTVPIKNGNLVLGTWQSILLFNFDIRPRKRKVVVTILGD